MMFLFKCSQEKIQSDLSISAGHLAKKHDFEKQVKNDHL